MFSTAKKYNEKPFKNSMIIPNNLDLFLSSEDALYCIDENRTWFTRTFRILIAMAIEITILMPMPIE